MKRISFCIILLLTALICTVPVNAVYVACTNGTAATIAVNWTFTGAPGTLALVSNVGTSQNALLDFTIPQGQNGAMGGDSSQFLFLNGTRAMTGALNMNSQQISNLVTGSTGGSAVNKTYVDSLPGGSPPDLTPFIFINGTRAYTGSQSMGGFQITNIVTGVLGTNAANKTYVDNAVAGVQGGDTSQFLFLNGTRGMTGNLNMSGSQILKLVTGATGDSAVNRTYVDSGLPYVLTTNATLVLTGNNSYVLTGGQRAHTADQSMGGYSLTNVNTGITGGNAANKTYVDNAIAGVQGGDTTQFLFLNGTRPMTGILNMSTQKIIGLGTPTLATDSATKGYVDTQVNNGTFLLANNASLVLIGNTSYILAGGSRAFTGDISHGSNKITGVVTGLTGDSATNKTYVDTAISGVGAPDLTPFLFINGSRAMSGDLNMNTKQISGLVTGATGGYAVNRSYVDSGLPYVLGTNSSLLLTGNSSVATTTYVGTVNTSMKNYVDTAVSGVGSPDLTPFLFLNGTRSMSGNLSMNSKYINGVISGALGTDAVNKSYVDTHGSNYNASYYTSIGINNTVTLSAGSSATVTNVGSGQIASLNFGIPQGVQGNQGNQGNPGNPGAAATIGVNSTTTGAAGSSATVTNVGSSAAASLDFVIPRGDTGTTPDVTQFLFINGTRAMTGNFQMGNQQITGLVSGTLGTSAINKTYVDTAISGVGAPDLSPFVFTNGTRAMSGNLQMGNQQITGLVTGAAGTTAVNRSYVDSGLPYVLGTNSSLALVTNTSIASTTYVNTQINAVDHSSFLFINGTRAMTGNLSMGSKYINGVITGALGTDAVNKTYVDTAVSGGSYVAASNASLLLTTNTSVATTTFVNTAVNGVDNSMYPFLNGTRAMTGNLSMGSKYINGVVTGALGSDAVNHSYVDAAISAVGGTPPDLTPFVFINGTRPMNGNLNMNSSQISGLVTGATGGYAVNRSYVDAGLPYITSSNTSIIVAGNTSFVASTNSSLLLTTNTTMVDNPVTSYITLMAGSAMIPTTNPVTMDQAETSTNKNNYIFVNFTDGGSENAQWIVDMPYDWNSTDATKGKLTFNFLWTATSGSGTVNFTASAKIFPDDTALDTALPIVGFSTDTLTTAGDMLISPDSTAALVTSAGTGGNTIIVKVARDSTTDTLNSDAKLIGVRVKYYRTLA